MNKRQIALIVWGAIFAILAVITMDANAFAAKYGIIMTLSLAGLLAATIEKETKPKVVPHKA